MREALRDAWAVWQESHPAVKAAAVAAVIGALLQIVGAWLELKYG